MARRAAVRWGAIGLLAMGWPGPAKTAEASSPDPLAPLAWLAGSCWTGTFADGRTKDFVCYEWTLEGKFLRSRHHVVGGGRPYSGETLFSFDRGGRRDSLRLLQRARRRAARRGRAGR